MLGRLMLKILKPMLDDMIVILFSTEYSKNPYLGITAVQKIGIKNIIEAEMRANSGKTLSRPYGSNLPLSPWDKLLLSPKQLFEFPTKDVKNIKTETMIGKRCKKPLHLSMPIMITGMSYGGSLSLNMHTVLAKASQKAGISTNTGESTIINEIRQNSKYVIGQLNRAHLLKEHDFDKIDALEIQLGQGAWGGACESVSYAKDIDNRLRNDWHLKEGENQIFKSRLDNVNSKDDLINLVKYLKEHYDFPIGIKIAASNYIEKELEIICMTKCDYIVIDGSEGGTSEAPPTLEDNVGLPTLYALIRTTNYLEKMKLKDEFDIIITGGLNNPGHFLKALALGANAVYIGSIALFAAVHNQAIKALPYLPPTQLFLSNGEKKNKLDISKATESLYNFLISCQEEMKLVLQTLSKTDIKELNKSDLVSLDKNISKFAKIDFVLK